MNKVTAVVGHGLVKAIGFVGIVAAVLVGGVPSGTVSSALAAPQVGSIAVAPKKPVTLPVTPKVIELPKLTLSESENVVTFDISQIQGMLKRGETLETDLLTKTKKSYAGALADFYALADKLCHVATLSPDMALAQQCSPTTKSRGLQEWGSAITYLSGIAQGVRPDSQSASSYAAFLRSNPGAVYLIVKGRSVIAAAVKDLQGVMNGTVRMANALPIEFDGCALPQKASGDQLSKACRSSLPVPPLMISSNDGKLVLTRQTKGDASVLIQINTRLARATKANPVANLPVDVQQASYSSSVSSSSKSSSSSSSVSFSSKSSSSSSTSSVSSSSKSSSSSSSVSSSSNSSWSLSESPSSNSSLSTSSSSSSFRAVCGKKTIDHYPYKGAPIKDLYVGGACLPLSRNIHSEEERIRIVYGEARFNRAREKAHKECLKKLTQNVELAPDTGKCPGGCPHKHYEGEEGCVNIDGDGEFNLAFGMSNGGDRFKEVVVSEDQWNRCFNFLCSSADWLAIEWFCTECGSESSSSSDSDSSLSSHSSESSTDSSTSSLSSEFSSTSSSVSSSSNSSTSSSSLSSSSKSSSSSTTTSSSSSSVSSTSPSSESSSSSLSSDNPSSPSSEDPSSYYSSSSAGDKIYGCMCDGIDGEGKIVRSESVLVPNTEAMCNAYCTPSKGWCTKTDGFGTTSKVRNCKWELTDPPLN